MTLNEPNSQIPQQELISNNKRSKFRPHLGVELIYKQDPEWFNPHTPIAQKVADEVIFRRFQGEGVEFFLIGPY